MELPIWARDLPLLLSEVYAKVGAVAPDEPEKLLIDLVEWINRLPSRHSRKTHISDVLHRKILTPYELDGIRHLQTRLEVGSDLRPFLGERTASIRNRRDEKRNPKMRNDLFYSDWGLHHFHLGADLANTGKRVMRTRRVLIAHLTESNAYLLDVAPHGKGFSDLWGQKSLLETLHRNWSDVLEKYQLKGLLGSSRKEPMQPHEYVQLRQSGLNAPIEINGKVFMGPGLGIATDGSSTRAVQLAGDIRYELAEGEKLFRDQQPNGEAFLFIGKDASVGFFDPAKNAAFSVFSGRTGHYRVTSFFNRIIQESGILANAPEGSIWASPLCRNL